MEGPIPLAASASAPPCSRLLCVCGGCRREDAVKLSALDRLGYGMKEDDLAHLRMAFGSRVHIEDQLIRDMCERVRLTERPD